MSTEKKDGKKPSSRLLSMKFMQRSIEKEMQEQLENERKRIRTEAEWVLDTKDLDIIQPQIQIECQTSYLPFIQDTVTPRISFNDFNKKIEKLKEQEEGEQRKRREEEGEKRNTVEDTAFAEGMNTIRSVKKKAKKRKIKDDSAKAKKVRLDEFIKPE